jgi:hypothetical protein
MNKNNKHRTLNRKCHKELVKKCEKVEKEKPVSKLQEERKRYYNLTESFHSESAVSSYITELEKTNKKMLEAFKVLSDGILPYKYDSGIIEVKLHKFPDIKDIIEEIEGKPIKENKNQ